MFPSFSTAQLRPSGPETAPKEAGRIACDRNEEKDYAEAPQERRRVAAMQPTKGA